MRKRSNAKYWETLWKKAANGVIAAQADVLLLRHAIGDALNVLGGPNMDYAPAFANKERQQKIAEAARILINAMKETSSEN